MANLTAAFDLDSISVFTQIIVSCDTEKRRKSDNFRNDSREFQHIGSELVKAREPNAQLYMHKK